MTAPDYHRQTRTGYDSVAEDYATLIPDLRAETSIDVAMIDDFAGRCLDAPTGPVADVGCGTGRVSAHLAAQGVDVFGVDLSPGMINVARRTHRNSGSRSPLWKTFPFKTPPWAGCWPGTP